MKGTVLTSEGQPVQVVDVTGDNDAQVAVVTVGASSLSIEWAVPPGHSGATASLIRQVRETVTDALRERDAHFLNVAATPFRGAVRNLYGVEPGSVTETVLSRSGRRVSFEFDHRTLETGTERYRVSIRRLPRR